MIEATITGATAIPTITFDTNVFENKCNDLEDCKITIAAGKTPDAKDYTIVFTFTEGQKEIVKGFIFSVTPEDEQTITVSLNSTTTQLPIDEEVVIEGEK